MADWRRRLPPRMDEADDDGSRDVVDDDVVDDDSHTDAVEVASCCVPRV